MINIPFPRNISFSSLFPSVPNRSKLTMGRKWVKKREKKSTRRGVQQSGRIQRKRGDPRQRLQYDIRPQGTVQVTKGKVRTKGKMMCRIHTKCDCLARVKREKFFS
ncbi:hypothetical protein XU18_3425 [Perkinsela sp. CCAP 1560/4]|nr:hypothetical protein XU18_3425 [Perkinsela sp. CCAP 1560/4]|eukprot:KNH05454.1 hypothetical protein XU18_3425 [Perkinsela sp. CCAP 1560/4]